MNEPLTSADTDRAEAWTFALDIYHPASLPTDVAGRITGDRYVLAHLERPGQASVRAMLAAALERGHINTATPIGVNANDLPVAAVVVMTAGCAASETWEIPTEHALGWWIAAADFRTVAPDRYFAAFPRVDDGHDSSA